MTVHYFSDAQLTWEGCICIFRILLPNILNKHNTVAAWSTDNAGNSSITVNIEVPWQSEEEVDLLNILSPASRKNDTWQKWLMQLHILTVVRTK